MPGQRRLAIQRPSNGWGGHARDVYWSAVDPSCSAASLLDRSATETAEVERLWRASAGSADGKRWPSVELQIVLPKAEIGPRRYATELIPDPDAITRILKLADAVLTYGVLRFADYSGYAPQLGSMLTGANEGLSRLIPRHQ